MAYPYRQQIYSGIGASGFYRVFDYTLIFNGDKSLKYFYKLNRISEIVNQLPDNSSVIQVIEEILGLNLF